MKTPQKILLTVAFVGIVMAFFEKWHQSKIIIIQNSLSQQSEKLLVARKAFKNLKLNVQKERVDNWELLSPLFQSNTIEIIPSGGIESGNSDFFLFNPNKNYFVPFPKKKIPVEVVSIPILASKKNKKALNSMYIDKHHEKLIVASGDGVFLMGNIDVGNQLPIRFESVPTNFNEFITSNFVTTSYEVRDGKTVPSGYGIKDIEVNEDTLFVSVVDDISHNCSGLRILMSNLEDGSSLKFKQVYETPDCVNKKNDYGKWHPVQSAGRIKWINDNQIILSTGEFRNRVLAQDNASSFGKLLLLDLGIKKAEILSVGYRNPHGLDAIFSNSTLKIITSEHGPLGGDEINFFEKTQNKSFTPNFGWPTVSYGKYYSKNEKRENELLSNDHEKFGMQAPLIQFTPSIGPSQIRFLNKCGVSDLAIVGTMSGKNKLGSYGLLVFNYKTGDQLAYLRLHGRIRDILINDNCQLNFVNETKSQIGSLNLTTLFEYVFKR